MNGAKDVDIMDHNKDLDFYLTTPNEMLKVNRNSIEKGDGYQTTGQTTILADGLPRDERRYGPYKPGQNGFSGIHPYLSRFEGPNSSSDELRPFFRMPRPPNIYFDPPVKHLHSTQVVLAPQTKN